MAAAAGSTAAGATPALPPMLELTSNISAMYDEAEEALADADGDVNLGIDCCAVCAKQGGAPKVVECPACQRIEYCSEAHRAKDRFVHNKVCAIMQCINDDEDAHKLVTADVMSSLWSTAAAAGAAAGVAASLALSLHTTATVGWGTYFAQRNTSRFVAADAKALPRQAPWGSAVLRNASAGLSFPVSLAHQLQTNPALAHVWGGGAAAGAGAADAPTSCVIHVVGAESDSELAYNGALWRELLVALGRRTPAAAAAAAATAASVAAPAAAAAAASSSSAAAAAAAAPAFASRLDAIRVVFVGPELAKARHNTVVTVTAPDSTPATLTLGFYRGTYHAYVKTKAGKADATAAGAPAKGKKGAAAGAAAVDARVRFTLPHVIVGFQLGLTVPDYDWSASLRAMQRVLHANFYTHSSSADVEAAAPAAAAPAPAAAAADDAFAFPVLEFGDAKAKATKADAKAADSKAASGAGAGDGAGKHALFSPVALLYSNTLEELEREKGIWSGDDQGDGEGEVMGGGGAGGAGGEEDDDAMGGEMAAMMAAEAAAAGGGAGGKAKAKGKQTAKKAGGGDGDEKSFDCECANGMARNPYASMSVLQSGTLANDAYRKNAYVMTVTKAK